MYQLAWELTQLIDKFYHDGDATDTERNAMETLSRKVLHFPTDTHSRINSIFKGSHFDSLKTTSEEESLSFLSTFIRIFDKYISSYAQWRVGMPSEIQSQLLRSYRRLRVLTKFESTNDSGGVNHHIETFRVRGSVLSIINDALSLIMNVVVEQLKSGFVRFQTTQVE